GPSPLTGSQRDRSQAPAGSPTDAAFAPLARTNGDATVTTLSNDVIRVSFSDFGGAINEVAFLQYSERLQGEEPFVFNAQRVEPILAITNLPGLGADTRYELVSQSAH